MNRVERVFPPSSGTPVFSMQILNEQLRCARYQISKSYNTVFFFLLIGNVNSIPISMSNASCNAFRSCHILEDSRFGTVEKSLQQWKAYVIAPPSFPMSSRWWRQGCRQKHAAQDRARGGDSPGERSGGGVSRTRGGGDPPPLFPSLYWCDVAAVEVAVAVVVGGRELTIVGILREAVDNRVWCQTGLVFYWWAVFACLSGSAGWLVG